MSTIELIGWGGVFFYLIAYLLLVLKKLSANKFTYHVLNALGAIGLIINAMFLKDNPNIVVNVVWSMIAMYAIHDIFKAEK